MRELRTLDYAPERDRLYRMREAAQEMFEALKECLDFLEDIICRNYSLTDDAEGMRDYLEELLARIDGMEEKV